MVRFPTPRSRVRRRIAVVATALAILGVTAYTASFQLAGAAPDTQAAAAVDTLRSYSAYAHAHVRTARSVTTSPPRVAVCLASHHAVGLSRSSGTWRLVSHPRGVLSRALAACR